MDIGGVHRLTDQTRKFICSGCGRELPISECSILGPDVLKPKPIATRWCSRSSCRTKQKLFSAKIKKDLDREGRELLNYYRNIGDKYSEEIVMAIYMVDKMEKVS